MQNEVVMRNDEDGGMEVALEAFGKSIARWTEKGEQHVTAVPGLSLFRREEPTGPISGMYEPSVCLVAQGAKRVLLGDDTYVYDAQHYLITSVHLPTIVQIIDASLEKPYLGLRLKLDLREISQLMVDSNLPQPRAQQSSRGMATGEVTLQLLTAFQRLIDLLAEPQIIPPESYPKSATSDVTLFLDKRSQRLSQKGFDRDKILPADIFPPPDRPLKKVPLDIVLVSVNL